MPVSAWYWCYSVSAAQLMTWCICVTPLWQPEWGVASSLDDLWWLYLVIKIALLGIYPPLLSLLD